MDKLPVNVAKCFSEAFGRAVPLVAGGGASQDGLLEMLMCAYGTHMQRTAFGMATTQAWAPDEFKEALQSATYAAGLYESAAAAATTSSSPPSRPLHCAFEAFSVNMKQYMHSLLTGSVAVHGNDLILPVALNEWVKENVADAKAAKRIAKTVDKMVSCWRAYSKHVVSAMMSDTALLHDATRAELSRAFVDQARRLGVLLDANVKQQQRASALAKPTTMNALPLVVGDAPRRYTPYQQQRHVFTYPAFGSEQAKTLWNHDPAALFKGYENQVLASQPSFRAVFVGIADIAFSTAEYHLRTGESVEAWFQKVFVDAWFNVVRVYFEQLIAPKYDDVHSKERIEKTEFANQLLQEPDSAPALILRLVKPADYVEAFFDPLLKRFRDLLEPAIRYARDKLVSIDKARALQWIYDNFDAAQDLGFEVGATLDSELLGYKGRVDVLQSHIPPLGPSAANATQQEQRLTAVSLPVLLLDSVGASLNKRRTRDSIAVKWLDTHPLGKRIDATWFLPSDQALKQYLAPSQLRFLVRGTRDAIRIRNELLDVCYYKGRLDYNELQRLCRTVSKPRTEGGGRQVFEYTLRGAMPPPAYAVSTSSSMSEWTFTCLSLDEMRVELKQFFMSATDPAGTPASNAAPMALPIVRQARIEVFNATGELHNAPVKWPVVHLLDNVLYPRTASIPPLQVLYKQGSYSVMLSWLESAPVTQARATEFFPVLVPNAAVLQAFDYNDKTRQYFQQLNATNVRAYDQLRDEFFSWSLAPLMNVGQATAIDGDTRWIWRVNHKGKVYIVDPRRLVATSDLPMVPSEGKLTIGLVQNAPSHFTLDVRGIVNARLEPHLPKRVPVAVLSDALHPLAIVPDGNQALFMEIVDSLDERQEELAARRAFGEAQDSSRSRTSQGNDDDDEEEAAEAQRRTVRFGEEEEEPAPGFPPKPNQRNRTIFAREDPGVVAPLPTSIMDIFAVGATDTQLARLSQPTPLEVAAFADDLKKAFGKQSNDWSLELNALGKLRVHPQRTLVVLPDSYWTQRFAGFSKQLDKLKKDMRKVSFVRSLFSKRMIEYRAITLTDLKIHWKTYHAPNLGFAVTDLYWEAGADSQTPLNRPHFVVLDNTGTMHYFSLEKLNLGDNRPVLWLATSADTKLPPVREVRNRTSIFGITIRHEAIPWPTPRTDGAASATAPMPALVGIGELITPSVVEFELEEVGDSIDIEFDDATTTDVSLSEMWAKKKMPVDLRAFVVKMLQPLVRWMDAHTSGSEITAQASDFFNAVLAKYPGKTAELDALRTGFKDELERLKDETSPKMSTFLSQLVAASTIRVGRTSKNPVAPSEDKAAVKAVGDIISRYSADETQVLGSNAATWLWFVYKQGSTELPIANLLTFMAPATSAPAAAAAAALPPVDCYVKQACSQHQQGGHHSCYSCQVQLPCMLMRKLVCAAGVLDQCIGNSGVYYTLFAPCDQHLTTMYGLAKLDALLEPNNRERLIAFVKAHIVFGESRWCAKDLRGFAMAATEVNTCDGRALSVREQGGFIYVCRHVEMPVRVSHVEGQWHNFGYVHVIDGLLV